MIRNKKDCVDFDDDRRPAPKKKERFDENRKKIRGDWNIHNSWEVLIDEQDVDHPIKDKV